MIFPLGTIWKSKYPRRWLLAPDPALAELTGPSHCPAPHRRKKGDWQKHGGCQSPCDCPHARVAKLAHSHGPERSSNVALVTP